MKKTIFGTLLTVVTAATIASLMTLVLSPPGVHGAGGFGLLNSAGGSLPWSSAAALTASLNTSMLHEKGPRWSVISHPATGSQATASKAAGGGAVQHVADCIGFSAASSSAPSLTFLAVSLRDGATGAGTVVHQFEVTVTAAAIDNIPPFEVCGLNIIGSANTAMTVEFSAGLANLAQSVMMTGYDVQ